MKVKKCTDANYCTCAIAVRASSDIYIIDRCDEDPKKRRFDFMSCVEDILHVVRKKGDEKNYEVSINVNYKYTILSVTLFSHYV